MHHQRSEQAKCSEQGIPPAGFPPDRSWLFAQAILGKPIPKLGPPPAEGAADRDRELLQWAAHFSPECERKLHTLLANEARTRDAWQQAQQFSETLLEATWDPAKHPRAGGPPNPGWFAATGGAAGVMLGSASSLANLTGEGSAKLGASGASGNARLADHTAQVNAPFRLASVQVASKGGNASSAPHSAAANSTSHSGTPEVAGDELKTTDSYRAKVQKALEILDPRVARWWRANSVNGEVRGGAWRWWWWSYYVDTSSGRPIIHVPADYTPCQTAQAIMHEVSSGYFADSLGAYYRKYKLGRDLSSGDFRKWQQGATAEAAHLASVLAELYVTSIASLTPAGDLVVTIGDLADNGPRWDQLVSILPDVRHLAIGAIIIQFGKHRVTIPKAVYRKLGLLSEAEQKIITNELKNVTTDAEAATVVKRVVAEIVAQRQVHHVISETVHTALENHLVLRGKYKLRDERFIVLAADLDAHSGYQGWHRILDDEIVVWLSENGNANEALFERWLHQRYAKPDLKKRFPNGIQASELH